MVRALLLTAGSVIFCFSASGQSLAPDLPLPMHSAAKHAGTYHVATSTWTRTRSGSIQRGTSDVIYNNTAGPGLYTTGSIGSVQQSFQFVDSGRIPSLGSAGIADRDNYNINEITVGYCIEDNTAAAADLLITIYGSYVPCSDPALSTCTGEFLAMGIPGATASNIANGYATCWTIDFDLSGGSEICILGDADGVFNQDLDVDSFGIGLEFDPGGLGGYVGSGIGIGPILAGDPQWTVQVPNVPGQAPGTGGVPGCPVQGTGGGGDTYYGPAECCIPIPGSDNSSGLDAPDFQWVGDRSSIGAAPGCYWFGGGNNTAGCNAAGGGVYNPQASMYIKIVADQTSTCIPRTCAGGGDILDFCAPGNNNSTGVPALLTGNFGSGFESGLHLSVANGPLPIGGFGMLGYILVGNQNSSPGISISDGQFCLIGNAGARFGRYNVAGTSRISIGAFDVNGDLENRFNTAGPSGFGFDVPSEAVIAGLPTTTIMSGDTYHFQCWYKDPAAGVGHSNFTNAISVTFP